MTASTGSAGFTRGLGLRLRKCRRHGPLRFRVLVRYAAGGIVSARRPSCPGLRAVRPGAFHDTARDHRRGLGGDQVGGAADFAGYLSVSAYDEARDLSPVAVVELELD